MKKSIFFILIALSLAVFFVPNPVSATTCTSSGDCQDYETCEGYRFNGYAAPTPGTCVAKYPLQCEDPSDTSKRCAGGESCVAGKCQPAPTCGREGKVCSPGQTCNNGQCVDPKALAAQEAAPPPPDQTGDCITTTAGFPTGWNPEICFKQAASWSVSFLLWILVKLLWLANQLFNLAIKISILDFAKYANMVSITFIWSLGRDLANVFFIFILMYIAIATIVQKGGGDVQKMVVKVIIIALLINFSIIIPKVVIDVGNSLAVVFYKSMGQLDASGNPDIGGVLVSSANPTQFFSKDLKAIGNTEPKITDLSGWTIIIRGLGTLILILILSYVLVVVSWLFFVRTITLLILIATSSLVFFSQVVPIPGLNYWNMWFKKLIQESFFAPAFLFMFYLVLKVAQELPNMGASSNSSAVGSAIGLTAAAGNTSSSTPIDQIFGYVLLVGLSIGSIMVARKMGAWSGKLGEQIKDNVAKRGGAWAARNSVGRVANNLAGRDIMKKMATARLPVIGGLASIPGRFARQGMQRVASSKFGGTQAYSDNSKARGETLKKEMDGMDNDQKAKYMRNLSSGSRTALYNVLNEEERTKIEGAAASAPDAVERAEAQKTEAENQARLLPGANADTIKKAGEDAYNKSISTSTQYITSQRANLGGAEKIKTYAKRINGEKDGNKKLELLAELTNEKERKAVIGDLNEQSLAKITTSSVYLDANNPLDSVLKKNIDDKVGGLDAEATGKVEKEQKAQKTREDNKERKAIIDTINTEASGATPVWTTLENEIATKKLSKTDIGNLSKVSVQHLEVTDNLLLQMKSDTLIALANNSHLTDSDGLHIKYQDLSKLPTASNSIKVAASKLAGVITP